ncbi:MAG TPA: recombinase family protein, partial [Pseudonocardiaceae bacterium]|nr:recombinase family protein [Pseudonocardiaceae bacterium]
DPRGSARMSRRAGPGGAAGRWGESDVVLLAATLSRTGVLLPGWRARRRRALFNDAIHSYQQATAMLARLARHRLALEGWHLGPAPYGYRLVPAPATDTATDTATETAAGDPGAGGVGRRVLRPDPRTAHVVDRVFGWRIGQRLGYTAIAHRLNTDPDRYPPPLRPTGAPAPLWTARMVHRILDNPRYTGRQVTHHRGTGPWSVSAPVHPPLVSDVEFWQAQQLSTRPLPWPSADPAHASDRIDYRTNPELRARVASWGGHPTAHAAAFNDPATSEDTASPAATPDRHEQGHDLRDRPDGHQRCR